MKRFLVLVLGVLWVIGGAGKCASAEAKIALIMGASEYQDGKGRHPLPGVNKDLPAMWAKLRGLGFEVSLMMNPSLDQAQRAVEEFSGRLRASRAVGLFYFAGGAAEFDGTEYLVLANQKVIRRSQLSGRALPVCQVLRSMEESGAGTNLVFLDGVRVFPGDRPALVPMHAKGVFLGGAMATEKLAAASFGGSLYTEKLLQYIDTPGLRVEDLHTLVMGDVRSLSPQQVPFQTSQLGAPFWFRPAFTTRSTPYRVFEPAYLQHHYRKWPETLARLSAEPPPRASPAPAPEINALGLSLDLFSSESRDSARCFTNVPRKGAYVVGGHGSPWYLSDDRGQTQDHRGSKLYPQDLAEEIRHDPGYLPGMPVTLYACRTGMGLNSFAQKLADELEVAVTAPEDVLWSNARGPTFVGPWKGNDRTKKDYTRQRSFKVFLPQPSSASFWPGLFSGQQGSGGM